ncbi:protein kinase domain-containing protein [Trichothermofontia sp.]
MTDPRSPSAGTVIASRYRILSLLGQGGFGRSYLAEDQNRFNEPCVLKEFAPQLQGSQALQKAKALFQREAGILYQLHHPQIPAFRELLQTEVQGQECLFLVQQYIPGPTYLEQLQQGCRWQETEAIQFLQQILPVLDYLHGQGIIHRDLAPDNLIREAQQNRPVLIDFGAVKQVAISAIQQFSPAGQAVATVVAKSGYTPPEQQYGRPVAASDLYALGVTTLVLLTGQSPAALRDPTTGVWHWQPWVSLTPAFRTLLMRMLAERVGDRYPSAQAVLRDLVDLAPGNHSVTPATAGGWGRSPRLTPSPPPMGPSLSQLQTLVAAPRRPLPLSPGLPSPPLAAHTPTTPVSRRSAGLGRLGGLLWRLVLTIGRVVLALLKWGVRGLLALLGLVIRTVIAKLVLGGMLLVLLLGFVSGFPSQWPDWLGHFRAIETWLPGRSESATNCQERIIKEMQAQNIPASERSRLYAIVDAQFYATYPHLEGRALTDTPADAQLRRAWCRLATTAIAGD